MDKRDWWAVQSMGKELDMTEQLTHCTQYSACHSLAHWINARNWASLVVQWLRICLLMQGTWVQSLVWEDSTCRGATRPQRHDYPAYMLQLPTPMCLSLCSTTRETTATGNLRTAMKSSLCLLKLEKTLKQQWRPTQPKIKKKEIGPYPHFGELGAQWNTVEKESMSQESQRGWPSQVLLPLQGIWS